MFIKFTDCNTNKPVYVVLDTVSSVKYDPNWNHANGTGATVISCNGALEYVQEPLAEVLSLLEGKDPYPARVLFSKPKDEK